mgnify:CR=1 FL=1
MLRIRTIKLHNEFELDATVEVAATIETCIGDESAEDTVYNDMTVKVRGDETDEVFLHDLLGALQEADAKFWPDASPEELLRCLVSACGYETEGDEATLLGHVWEYFSPSGPGAAAREVQQLRKELCAATKRLDEAGAELHDLKQVLGTMVTMEDYLKVVTARDDAESRFRVSDGLRSNVAEALRRKEEEVVHLQKTSAMVEKAQDEWRADLQRNLQARTERFQTLQEENLRLKEHIRGLQLLMETMVRDYQMLQEVK